MQISTQKKDKISEQILAFLFLISPKSEFTSSIAKEIIRDEEFTKQLLISLKNKKFIKEITKNPKGIPYSKRSRWVLSNQIYQLYKQQQK